jgi:DNA-binding LacI/PurR family transcriptional regulator
VSRPVPTGCGGGSTGRDATGPRAAAHERNDVTDGTRGGARRVTIKDVARAAGVSPALVSIVLNDAPGASEQTRERVRRLADELGYRPDAHATMLRRRRARLLGVGFSVQSAFHGDLLPGIYAAAEAAGYEVTLSGWTAARTEERAVQALLTFRCDALVLLGSELDEARLATIVGQMPVVVVGRRLVEPVADAIRTDDLAGLRLAVDHLVALGHRHITHVDGGPPVKAADRVAGYLAAMEAHGLGGLAEVVPGGQTVEDGIDAGRRLVASPGARTALVAYDDDCAWGVMGVMGEAGVAIPGDLSLVGFDGSRLSRLTPLAGLTTVRQDAGALASLAVERAVRWIEHGRAADREVVLAPSLIVGRTTAPLDR